eukprot:TRINITY_DN15781_c0_g1_i2.p1 TRINITY_DN15781_c0_g1~~TRINITY_DN15781_c0_g1_i2.p1  ORF type:complete len:235 (+),score=58.83 TRINITY_DN15781_c0_g1_i2:70-774(+)
MCIRDSLDRFLPVLIAASLPSAGMHFLLARRVLLLLGLVLVLASSEHPLYALREQAFATWMEQKAFDISTARTFENVFGYCLRTARQADPLYFELGDDTIVAGELAHAVVSLDETLDDSHDLHVGDAQWHALRVVLDWLQDWDREFLAGRTPYDPAEAILQLPVAFQYMSHSNKATMFEAIPYIQWAHSLLERVVEQRQCLRELQAASHTTEIVYWAILSRPCAMLVHPASFES